jgi:hypothetical protein
VGAIVAAALLAVLAVRWSRRRDTEAGDAPASDPALERRIDDELARLDS